MDGMDAMDGRDVADTADAKDAAEEAEGRFELGEPVLVCRWRLSGRSLPLLNRHIRAFSQRRLQGVPPTPELTAWVKSHVEGTLGEGAAAHPDGVLMVVVDEKGQGAMTVGPYAPLTDTTVAALAVRALSAATEAETSAVAPETLWALVDGTAVVSLEEDADPAAATGLVRDLLQTKGYPVAWDAEVARKVREGAVEPQEVFLVSDEHGILCASDRPGPVGADLACGLERLRTLEAEKRARRRF